MKSILLRTLLLSCLAGHTFTLNAGQPGFLIAKGLRGIPDSNARELLYRSLDGFLQQKEGDNARNTYIWQPELAATSLLLDEMKGIGYHNSLKVQDFYKAKLTNVVALNDHEYLLQLAYEAVVDDQAVQRAAFRLIARKQRDGYLFYAPLRRHTLGWKQHREQGVLFYYKDTINLAKARAYSDYNDRYLGKLSKPQQTTLYCCDDFPEALQLCGVDYKAAYNGYRRNTLSTFEQGQNLMLNGTLTSDFNTFDPHDMWHDKLRTVLPAAKINRAVDEGCAYLYGGSWGLSWDSVKYLFKAYVRAHPQADWLQLYLNSSDFRSGNEPLKVAYFINALIVQQIEQERGFPAVMKLLSCGKREDDDNYFAALEPLTGISKRNFNSRIGELIRRL
ncbi:hypothetical protein [Taibaiella helva]|uniref:hypothetical protein n=1 Tax=Taibaiella helva TaxID=2301235 RepID=UPI000E5972FA|nr:hypothetical protein [Taibaiella helva]